MGSNLGLLRQRVKSMVKVVAETLNLDIDINNKGDNSTDCTKKVSIADPLYYINKYGLSLEYGQSAQTVVALCMYSAIHEGGHVLFTDTYKGRKEVKKAIKYVIKSRPNLRRNLAFQFLNIVEDYRMMQEVISLRAGTEEFYNTANDFIGKYNVSHVRQYDKSLYLMHKIFTPHIPIEDSLVQFSEEHRTKLDLIAEEIRSMPLGGTTLDSADIVIKHYNALYTTDSTQRKKFEGLVEDLKTVDKIRQKQLKAQDRADETDNTDNTKTDTESTEIDIESTEIDIESTETDVNSTDPQQTAEEKALNEMVKDLVETQQSEWEKAGESPDALVKSSDMATILLFDSTDGITTASSGYDCDGVSWAKEDIKSSTEFNDTDVNRVRRTVLYRPQNTINSNYIASYLRADANKVLSRLERLLSLVDDDYVPGKSSGKLDTKKLQRCATNPNVFKSRKDQGLGGVAVYILVDASGSMGGDKISIARSVVSILNYALSTLGIRHEAWSFNVQSTTFMATSEESLRSITTNTMVKLADDSGRNNCCVARGCNRDGLAIDFITSRMRQDPEQTKLLFVISDGMPADVGYGDRFNGKRKPHRGQDDTIRAIRQARKHAKVTGMYLSLTSTLAMFREREQAMNKDKAYSEAFYIQDFIKDMYGNDYAKVSSREDIATAIIRSFSNVLEGL